MKRQLITVALALIASAGTSLADSGTFGFGIELQASGVGATNSGQQTLYALDNSGGSRLLPTNSSATLNTSWTSASSAATPSFNLGTFTTANSLELLGGSMLTYKNNGSDVTASTLEYQIYPSSSSAGNFTAVNLPFNYDNVNGSQGDQRWATEASTTNLLTGLAPGSYTLNVYGFASTSDGNKYESGINGGNYGATFTVVAAPEPGVWAMMLGGLGILVGVQRLRRKSSV